MKWLNGYRMRLAFVGFVAAVFLGGGSAKADFIWTQKADMPTPRWVHTSAVVNGKIYIIGGSTSQPGARALSTVEEYDPVTNTWTRKADMPTARTNMVGSSAVVDGKIYVIGGDDAVSWGSPTVYEYNPATDTWARKADMPTPRWSLATCAVDGKIYAIGGAPTSYTGLSVVEQYDPITDTWTRKADMPTGLYGLCANVVNGKIYTVGGRPGLYAGPYAYQYDPATDTWTPKSNMLLGTSQMASVVLDDKIIVIGGWDISTNSPYKTVQTYDPEMDIWTRRADAPFLRACPTADVVNNRIYVIGGTDRPHPCPALSTVYEFGPLLDFNSDGIVDIEDLVILIESWGTDNPLCDIAPPLHGDGIVDILDLEVFMSSWGQAVDDPTLVAHYKLDEAEGFIAVDSAGENDAALSGGPLWQPEGGQVGGALQLDGVDGYLITPFILNPADGPFSVFAWVKGGIPDQVIVSQIGGVDWLCADPSQGRLMTGLGPPPGRNVAQPLVSELVITDGNWHRIGFVWDGSHRRLCVDGVVAAEDTQAALAGSVNGLYIGCGKAMGGGTFWSGLIDDVRLYRRAVSP